MSPSDTLLTTRQNKRSVIVTATSLREAAQQGGAFSTHSPFSPLSLSVRFIPSRSYQTQAICQTKTTLSPRLRLPTDGLTMTLEDLLCTAAANGDAPLAEELLRAGAQVNGTNRFGRTAIQVGRSCTGCLVSSSQHIDCLWRETTNGFGIFWPRNLVIVLKWVTTFYYFKVCFWSRHVLD